MHPEGVTCTLSMCHFFNSGALFFFCQVNVSFSRLASGCGDKTGNVNIILLSLYPLLAIYLCMYTYHYE